MQDRPNQPDAKPLPPPTPPPEKSVAVNNASAIGRLESKGYDPRSAPFEQKKAPEGKVPAGSEDPIQKSLVQKGLDAAKNAPHKGVEALQKKIADTRENPVPLALTAATHIASELSGVKLQPTDTMLAAKMAKDGGRGMVAAVEAKFPRAAETVNGVVDKGVGKVNDALQNLKEKVTPPPPKDPQGPLFR